MLCSTESMHPALVSSTGVSVQWGMTCGDTFTVGFDGGTMPPRLPVTGAVVTTTMADPRASRDREAARASAFDTARVAGWCRLPYPFAPSCPGMDQPAERTIRGLSGPRGRRANCPLIAGEGAGCNRAAPGSALGWLPARASARPTSERVPRASRTPCLRGATLSVRCAGWVRSALFRIRRALSPS